MARPTLSVLPQRFAIHRLRPGAPLPAAVKEAQFCWIGRTDEELSVVCDVGIALEDATQEGMQRSGDWACFKVAGPIDFAVTGLLAELATVLAAAGVSIFALSTFDTDYVLVRDEQLGAAQRALRAAGYPMAP